MKTNEALNIPKSNGHYAMWVEHKGSLYLSGQLPIHPITKEVPAGIEAQTKLLLQNIELTLKEAGSSKNHILRNEIFIADFEHWPIVDKVYADFFGDHKPARIVVGNAGLHLNCLIEIVTTATTL
ncbi:RidA family protein [Aquimarina megaterium]|uniref:RidA family protein n=1 Tax=Aquimarina megaterium TaxID=1443666 RepID=UPI000942603F|nr:RidA family protein [Aquimarina megaterium]